MCGPTNTKQRKRVVISGAGPAGLLLSSLLLNKNKDPNCSIVYDITLLDGRQDYASFTKKEMQETHRSWMLALADHGVDAIKTLPTLYEDYVKGEGINVREFNIFLGEKRITQNIDAVSSKAFLEYRKSRGEPADIVSEQFIVDRNFVVAALARYLRDTHENDPNYTSRYETKCQYVDYENKQVLVRDCQTQAEEYLPYDLLIGCDGVRSTVREALVKKHSDFSMEYTDIFSNFKQAHIQMPPGISTKGMSIIPNLFGDCQGILLPETGDMVNMSIGCYRNNFDKLAEELKSDDYTVVSEYVKKNLKGFELVDYDDFAKQWVGQRWNQTGMVHCNFYHSLKCGVVIMGDAAHATSPSIGMGMNTALRDAQIFSEILEECQDDFEKALPAFSKARVKEGNSLSDLAYNLYCLDTKHQMIEVLHSMIRSFFFLKFPFWVNEHPQTMIGRRGVALSEVYDQAVKTGIMDKHRAINNSIRQHAFEEATGMVTTPRSNGRLWKMALAGAVLAIAVGYGYQTYFV